MKFSYWHMLFIISLLMLMWILVEFFIFILEKQHKNDFFSTAYKTHKCLWQQQQKRSSTCIAKTCLTFLMWTILKSFMSTFEVPDINDKVAPQTDQSRSSSELILPRLSTEKDVIFMVVVIIFLLLLLLINIIIVVMVFKLGRCCSRNPGCCCGSAGSSTIRSWWARVSVTSRNLSLPLWSISSFSFIAWRSILPKQMYIRFYRKCTQTHKKKTQEEESFHHCYWGCGFLLWGSSSRSSWGTQSLFNCCMC